MDDELKILIEWDEDFERLYRAGGIEMILEARMIWPA